MIVRQLRAIMGTAREVAPENGNWISRRLLLHGDGMGFSLHDTTIHAGTKTFMWYKHHVEAVYCLGGEGELENLETGEVHQVTDGTMYALDGNERHRLLAKTDMRMVCVFNPPLTGQEVHDEEGIYPLIETD
jgi:L-ectoine synthase